MGGFRHERNAVEKVAVAGRFALQERMLTCRNWRYSFLQSMGSPPR